MNYINDKHNKRQFTLIGKENPITELETIHTIFVGFEVIFSVSCLSDTGSLLPSLVVIALNSSQAFSDWHLIGFWPGATSPHSALQYTLQTGYNPSGPPSLNESLR